MPLNRCTDDGSPGWKWGETGKCYTYTADDEASEKRAKKAAVKQALAIGGGKPPAGEAIKTMAALETVDLDGVEIAAAGVTAYGAEGFSDQSPTPIAATFDVERLQAIADATNEATDLRAPLKIGHSIEQALLRNSGLAIDEQPAAGWLSNLRVKGDKLVADVKGVPKSLAELTRSAFRTRSPEIGAFESQETGKTYPEVVRGLALLGVTPPAFQTLDDIVATFSGREESAGLTAAMLDADEALDDPDVETVMVFATPAIIWNPERGAQDVMEDLRRRLNPPTNSGPEMAMGPGSRYWVRDVQLEADGGRALVEDYESGDSSMCWVVPFSIGDDGDPVPAEQSSWTLAQQAWVEVSAAADDERVAAYSNVFSGDRKRRDTRERMPDVDPKPETTEETKVELSAEEASGLRKLLQVLGLVRKDDDGAEGEVKPEAVAAFAKAVGVEGETDLAKIVAAIEERGKEKAEPIVPDGMVIFSASERAELEAKAEAGVRAEKALAEEKKSGFLRTFARQGRIAPSDFERFGEMYDKLGPDATKDFLSKLPVDEKIVRTFGAPERDEMMEVFGNEANENGITEDQVAAYCAATGIPFIPVNDGGES